MPEPRHAAVIWQDLRTLSRFEVARELAMPLLALSAALLAGLLGWWPALVLASFVVFMTGLRVTHGAFHRSIGLRGTPNDLVMFTLSALLGGSMHAIEVTHLRHHRDCLGPDDVEGHIAALGFMRALLASPRYPLLIHRAGWRHGSRRQRRWIAAELIAAAGIQTAIWTSGSAALQAIALSLYVANAFAAIPGIWCVHHGGHHDPSARLRSTRSRWIARLTVNMFHHAEHHAFPAVPTCRLPQLALRFDRARATPQPILGQRGPAPGATA